MMDTHDDRAGISQIACWCSGGDRWPVYPYPASEQARSFDPLETHNKFPARLQFAGACIQDA